MHSKFSLLEVSFELLLFSLFVYKLYDLGKAYLLPFLYQSLAEEKNLQTEILEKEKLLVSTHHRLENQINQQNRTFMLLNKKVQIWHAAVEAERELSKREEASRLENLKIKRIAQQTYLAQALLSQHAVPSAVHAAKQLLAQEYAQDQGKQQLTNLINKLLVHDTDHDHD